MPRLNNVREQRVQFFYDTDFLYWGNSSADAINAASANKVLFADARPGNPSRTNMPSPGQLTGDQTFVCFAVRHEVLFHGGSSAVSAGSVPAGSGDTASVTAWTIALSTFALTIGAKPQFEGPISMTPAGGGPWGFVSDSTQPIVLNGEPQQQAIYVLPVPVNITQREAINMLEVKSNLQNTLNLVNLINTYDGGKCFRAYIDGYNTRDVQ